jgi:FkbM family methyltransferase
MSLEFPVLRALPELGFHIAVDPDSTDPIIQAIRTGFFTFSPAEEALLSVLGRGKRVVDLGAHIGTFALAAAAAGCYVTAVEASPVNVRLLEASIRENDFDRVEVISAAVSDRPGKLRFVEMGPFGQLCGDDYGGPSIEVPAVTLDGLLEKIGWDRVDYVKIDIEGAELAAFRGMVGLLSRPAGPAIVYESNDHILYSHEQSSADLIGFLESFGYTSYSVRERTLRPASPDSLQIPTVADYIAVKDPPGAARLLERLPGWALGPPETVEEKVEQILSEARLDIVTHRDCLAKTLSRADAELLGDERVRQTIKKLLEDPAPEVRDAARGAARRAESLVAAGRS